MTTKWHQYRAGSAAGLAGLSGGLLVSLLNLWLINQILSKTEFGAYTLALTIVYVAGILITAGLERFLVYRIAEAEGSDGELLEGGLAATVLLATAGLGVAGAGLVYAIGITAGGVNQEPAESFAFWLTYMGLLLPFLAANSVFSAWYQGSRRFGGALILSRSREVVYTLGLVVVLTMNGSHFGVLTALVASGAVSLLIWFVWTPLRAFAGYQPLSFSDISYGLKLSLARFAQTGIDRLDILMLGWLTNSAAVAEYAVAARLAAAADLGNKITGPIFVPRLRHLVTVDDRNGIQREYGQIRVLNTGFATLLAAAFLLSGDNLLGLFGDYELSIGILVLLTASYLIKCAFGPNGRYLNMAGHANLTLSTTVIALGLHVVLNMLLIPVLGAMGAAAATLASVLLVNSLVSYIIKRNDRLDTINLRIACLIVSMLAAVAVVVTDIFPYWAMAAFVFAAASLLLALEARVQFGDGFGLREPKGPSVR